MVRNLYFFTEKEGHGLRARQRDGERQPDHATYKVSGMVRWDVYEEASQSRF